MFHNKASIYATTGFIVLLFGGVIYSYLYADLWGDLKLQTISQLYEAKLPALLKEGLYSYPRQVRQMKWGQMTNKSEATNAGTSSEAQKISNQYEMTTLLDNATSTTASLTSMLTEKIRNNNTIPLLTLFTTWIDTSDKYLVHNLTVRNWMSFSPVVIPVMFTNESVIAERCRRLGWKVLPVSVTAAGGIPVLKYMFQDAMRAFNTTLYAYSNGDILYTNGLVNTLISLIHSDIDMKAPMMLVGKRTNVNNLTEAECSSWANLSEVARRRGKLFIGEAEDFFITTRNYPWKGMAEVVIGRRAYDNWLVYYTRKLHYVIIDVTETVLAIHQTTSKGNFEGHRHKNPNYNHNLLVKMYKTIKYGAGIVDCVERHTRYENSSVVLKIRSRHSGHCSVN